MIGCRVRLALAGVSSPRQRRGRGAAKAQQRRGRGAAGARQRRGKDAAEARQRNKPRRIPRRILRHSPRHSPRRIPRHSPRRIPCHSPRRIPRHSPRRIPRRRRGRGTVEAWQRPGGGVLHILQAFPNTGHNAQRTQPEHSERLHEQNRCKNMCVHDRAQLRTREHSRTLRSETSEHSRTQESALSEHKNLRSPFCPRLREVGRDLSLLVMDSQINQCVSEPTTSLTDRTREISQGSCHMQVL